MKHLILLLALPMSLWFAACESMPAAEDGGGGKAAEAGEGDEAADSSADEIAKCDRAVQDARIELKIALAETESTARKAQDEVESAENAVKVASDALDHFLKSERDFELSNVQLGVDRATWGLEAERQELAELEAMYKKDDVAALTKELVLQRGKKGVEFAERGLAHEQREAAMKRDFELPKKLRELEVEKREKENELREARAEQTKSKDEIELKLRKARAAVEDAEKALTKARAKAAKAAKA
jgi:hypothetical protein